VDTACAPMPPKPHGVYHSSRENFRKKSKNQKVFDFSNFSIFSNCSNFSTFRLFDFSNFSIFSTFRAEISWHVNFSTFRGQKSWFSRCDRYQPEEHTEFGNPPYTLAAINNYLLGMVGIPHPTHKNGDDLGMVYGIGFTTFWGKQIDGGIDWG